MGSQSSSSGWFKQAEQIEQERKSGTVPPPAQRIAPRPPAKQPPTPRSPIQLSPAGDDTPPEEPVAAPAAEAAPPPAAAPRPTPKAPLTVADLPDPGTRAMLRSPFHKPPAAYRRAETPTPRPEARPSPASAVAAPPSGRFSLVPDGPGHRLVYARPGDAATIAPVVVARLGVAELRQLAASLTRYLGAVDPQPAPGTTPDMVIPPAPPTPGS
jgi:hypothetical protein